MKNSKPFERPQDFCVFISFHSIDASSLNATVERLDELMEKRFGEAQRREYVSKEQLEIVYRVQKPIIADDSIMEEFFVELRSMFNATSALRPHFTQFEVQE